MGIDIYARWSGMDDSDKEEQYTAGCSTAHGHVGYLREAYHGGPYATRVLVPEAFAAECICAGDDDDPWCEGCNGAPIPAATLAARLPQAVLNAVVREAEVYGSTEARTLLCECGLEPKLERRKTEFDLDADTDIAATVGQMVADIFSVQRAAAEAAAVRTTDELPRFDETKHVGRFMQFPMVQSLFAFVALCRFHEDRTGVPVRIIASY